MTDWTSIFSNAYNNAAKVAADVSSPVFDALGNVEGWLVEEAAVTFGTGTMDVAMPVVDATNKTVGVVVKTAVQAGQAVAQVGGGATQVVYDGAGEIVGTLVKPIATALSWIVPLALSAAILFFVVPAVGNLLSGDD